MQTHTSESTHHHPLLLHPPTMDYFSYTDHQGSFTTSTSTSHNTPPPDYTTTSDIDSSFTSTTTSSFTSTSNSSRSSFSPSLIPFSSSSSTLLRPLPHHSPDPRWFSLLSHLGNGSSVLHLQLLQQLGSGNLARVYRCRLLDDPSGRDFALKVVDLTSLPKGKLRHVDAEADALSSLDHPFLPTLYARLRSPTHSCLLLDYCPGGDLHSLLRRQPSSRFPLPAARFFAAEVLLALEYLHLHGLVYRDLKPENVLRRADGHLMLSDFDLCFRATCTPRGYYNYNYDHQHGVAVEVVAEPGMEERSWEHVGTHEYLAPEVLGKGGHGAAVDWWAFGVLLYEMLYGRTPFKGRTKESTLRNIRSNPLVFSKCCKEGALGEEEGMAEARDLMERLLVKDPRGRMGSAKGAAEIKRHPFFHGIKWALIRCYPPPVVRGEVRKRRALGEYVVRSGKYGKKGRRGSVGKRLMGLLFGVLGRKKKHGQRRGVKET